MIDYSNERGNLMKLQIKIKSENLLLDKLLLIQLNILCAHKKRDLDKIYVLKLKQNELVALWLEWQHRLDVAVESISALVLEGHSDDISNKITNRDPVVNVHDDNIMNVDNNDVVNKSGINMMII